MRASTQPNGWFYLAAVVLLFRLSPAAAENAVSWSLDGPPSAAGPWVVEIALAEREDVDRVTRIVEPWAVYPEKSLAVARVDAGQWRRLAAEGFQISIDLVRTLRLDSPPVRLPGQRSGIPGFPCYRTIEESYAAAAALAAARPELVRWTDIGDSWERSNDPANGFDLRVLTIGANPGIGPRARPKPRFLVLAGLHPREYASSELALRFGELLVAKYGHDPNLTWLLDEYEVLLVLQANPDGRKAAEGGLLQRKNTDDSFCREIGERGVDLNRNFEFAWGCCGGGSPLECSLSYRGPSPSSEPETAAYEALMRRIFPDQRGSGLDSPADTHAIGLVLDLHSFGEDVLWSWGFTVDRPPNDAALYALGRKLAFFNGYRPQHGSLSTVDGATKDFAYGELGVPGYTIELGTDFFQDCASFEGRIAPDNLEMLAYAARVVGAPYREPFGPDAVDPRFLPRAFDRGEVAELTVLLDDTRYSRANGVEPSQPITAGELSIDEHPRSAEVTIPLIPSDGAFDSRVEEAFVPIATAGLRPGRHTVFVRGRDASGVWGSVSATFLHVVEPGVVAVLEGRVRDPNTDQGVEGVVHVGPFQTRIDPESGRYRVVLPPEGQWALEVKPRDRRRYLEFSGGLIVTGPERPVRLRRNIELRRLDVVDDIVWQGRGGWVEHRGPFLGEAHATLWSDSPDGHYPARSERFLTSEPIDVGSTPRARLIFQHAFDFESGFDFGVVEISRDGRPWEVLAKFSGTQSSWRFEDLLIDRLDDVRSLSIRFRSSSDETVERDGWQLGGPALASWQAP